MPAALKRCKECGKLFTPKGRESYCSAPHYRPCPICGTPVEVTYFSDPPKKCPNCKYRKVKPLPEAMKVNAKSLFNVIPDEGPAGLAQLKAEMDLTANKPVDLNWMDEVDTSSHPTIDAAQFCDDMTGSVMVYIGNPHTNGFIPGHQYLLKVERADYVYEVSSEEDVTASESCNIMQHYASQISFYQNFGKKLEHHSAGKGHTY